MLKEKMGKLWARFVNRETVSYFIFGVLTTAVDWMVYPLMRWLDHSVAWSSVVSWAASDFCVCNQQDICLSELYVPAEGAFEGVCVFCLLPRPDGGLHSSGHGGYRGCNGLE